MGPVTAPDDQSTRTCTTTAQRTCHTRHNDRWRRQRHTSTRGRGGGGNSREGRTGECTRPYISADGRRPCDAGGVSAAGGDAAVGGTVPVVPSRGRRTVSTNGKLDMPCITLATTQPFHEGGEGGSARHRAVARVTGTKTCNQRVEGTRAARRRHARQRRSYLVNSRISAICPHVTSRRDRHSRGHRFHLAPAIPSRASWHGRSRGDLHSRHTSVFCSHAGRLDFRAAAGFICRR